MYSSLANYAAAFGQLELFQLLADEQPLLSEQLLADFLDGNFPGAYTADEQAAMLACEQRVNTALTQASLLMDSYIATRYQLPLATQVIEQNPLGQCANALARAMLADDANNQTDTMEKAQSRWLKWLEQLAKGQVVLQGGSTTSDNTGEQPQNYLTAKLPSGIDWGRYS